MLKLKIQYNVKSQLIGKNPEAGKAWGQEEKEATEDETVQWHHRFDALEIGRVSGDHERQGGLDCYSPW